MLLQSSSRSSQQFEMDILLGRLAGVQHKGIYSTVWGNDLCAIPLFLSVSMLPASTSTYRVRSTFHNQSIRKTVTPMQLRYHKNHRPVGSL